MPSSGWNCGSESQRQFEAGGIALNVVAQKWQLKL